MSYLLDTCVLPDIAKNADAGLVAWVRAQNPATLHLSVLSLAELRKRADLLPDGPERHQLHAWLDHELPAQFAGRIIPIDAKTALAYGQLAAAGRKEGRELWVIDGLLLATAHALGLTLVTRSTRDVHGRGVPVLSPYSDTLPGD